MDRTRKPDDISETLPDRPGLVLQKDRESSKADAPEADAVFENGDMRYDEEPDGELPEEDDDNPYQESDEALPEDDEERAISNTIESDNEDA